MPVESEPSIPLLDSAACWLAARRAAVRLAIGMVANQPVEELAAKRRLELEAKAKRVQERKEARKARAAAKACLLYTSPSPRD